MAESTTTQSDEQPAAGSGLGGKSLADLVEMASLRWQLAELEVRSDLAAARRLGVVAGAGIVAALAALPVLTVVLAGQLDNYLANPFPWVTLSAGCLLLIGGLLVAWMGWRRFRHEFSGLRESLDECREDMIWLREWVDGQS